MEEEKDTKSRWIHTDWDDQGYVCQVGKRIFYLSEFPSGEIKTNSMSLEEWNDILDKVKVVDDEEETSGKSKRRSFSFVKRGIKSEPTAKKCRKSSGKRSIKRSRIARVSRNK